MNKKDISFLLLLCGCFLLICIWQLGITLDCDGYAEQESNSYATTENSTSITEGTTECATMVSTTMNTTTHSHRYSEWLGVELTEEDYKLLCTTVYCEAGNQSMETQYMVALTVLNRYVDRNAASIRQVIYEKNAYEVTTWKNFESYGYTEQVKQAVDKALKVNIHPKTMLYFRDSHYHSFGIKYVKSGNLYFSLEDDK